MDPEVSDRTDLFIERVKGLFKQVEEWLSGTSLTTNTGGVAITEETSGRYTVPLMAISAGRSQLAQLRPVGAYVIAAEGRVDLVGKLDQQAFVYLLPGGPRLHTSIRVGHEKVSSHSRQLFEGVAEPGWFWIESKLRGTAHVLDRNLFLDLLAEVSDYDLR